MGVGGVDERGGRLQTLVPRLGRTSHVAAAVQSMRVGVRQSPDKVQLGLASNRQLHICIRPTSHLPINGLMCIQEKYILTGILARRTAEGRSPPKLTDTPLFFMTGVVSTGIRLEYCRSARRLFFGKRSSSMPSPRDQAPIHSRTTWICPDALAFSEFFRCRLLDVNHCRPKR